MNKSNHGPVVIYRAGRNFSGRAIMVEDADGYGIGLDYARDMIKPA